MPNCMSSPGFIIEFPSSEAVQSHSLSVESKTCFDGLMLSAFSMPSSMAMAWFSRDSLTGATGSSQAAVISRSQGVLVVVIARV